MASRRGFMVGGATGLGAAILSSGRLAAAAEQVMSLSVLYPNHEGARFDTAYYRATHIPLAMKVMKADKVTLIEGIPMEGSASAPPYAMIAHFQFASAEALKAAVADPGMAEVRADVARYTDIKPTVMVGKWSS